MLSHFEHYRETEWRGRAVTLTDVTEAWAVIVAAGPGSRACLARVLGDAWEAPLGSLYTLLRNKYYFDELYDFLFVRPAYWVSETLVSVWVDRGVIDGTLHLIGRVALRLGDIFRNYFDLPIINRLIGDGSADVTYWFGGKLRAVQTGRVQQYLMFALIVFIAVGAALYFFVLA